MELKVGNDGVIRVIANVSYVADEIPKPKLGLRFTNENQSYEEMNCISCLSHHTECHLEIRYHTHEQVPSVYSIIFDNGKRELFKQGKLLLTKETKHRYLSKGEPFSESCESPPSSPIQWFLYRTPITQNTAAAGKNNYSMITGNAISIESVGPINAGTYVCSYNHNPHVILKNISLSIIDKTRISFQPTHNNVTLEMWITYAGSDSSPPALFQCALSKRLITMNNTQCITSEVGEGNCYLKYITDFAANRCFIVLGDFYFEEEFKTDVKEAENGCVIKRSKGKRKQISKQCPDIIHDPESTSNVDYVGSPPNQVSKDSSFYRRSKDISLPKLEAESLDLKEDTKIDTIGQSTVVTARNSVANQNEIGNEEMSPSTYLSSVSCENIERNSEEIERSRSNDELSKLMV
ncbi:hypothetical protein HELRODRAFT_177864 [Helobdella robusta]|uniref:Ig-like domain-containing protein n=1 Tax=Helobdella robusta TaxID=6412 RepID=T1FCD8_HELRO|nr:hypothetical protein HELRODRAFT_177864 [Helobdella robusta]ESN97799.1 hypothetical protein HELRODRAFT_177864 [Helobdella robusta]